MLVVQVIDDSVGHTLASVSTLNAEVKSAVDGATATIVSHGCSQPARVGLPVTPGSEARQAGLDAACPVLRASLAPLQADNLKQLHHS